jgi:hypothetical protein
MHADDNRIPDDAAARLAAERAVEISPAQPDDAHRIEASGPPEPATKPAHVKRDHAGRMEH